MPEEIIHVSNLIVDFPSVRAINDISLSVADGDIFGLLGPDGAGKTTTIRVLATILKPTSGTVSILGADIVSHPRDVRGRIGYISQRFTLYGDLTVEENLKFFADIYGLVEKERIKRMRELLEFARLTEFVDRRADYLSGGMKQKLALACTLISEPQILLLDEPTTGVDPVSRREFWAILSELRTRGMTLLVSTPYMDEAERCSKVAFMDAGKIRINATPHEIKELFKINSISLMAKPLEKARKALEGHPFIKSIEVYGERIELTVDSEHSTKEFLEKELKQNGAKLESIVIKAPTMESAFIELIKGERIDNREA